MKRESYSCSLISQGSSKFYSLTMPSEILSETCFVSTRDTNPHDGFQRMLDKNRAQEIADYIDSGKGSIPTAIILSAQEEAALEYNSKNKTIDFNLVPKAFLILDGQHRVYGFSLAKTSVRVPVIIYNGLSRKEETRLFVDINTKQRPVPSELVLDIKSLAEYETNIEALCHAIYDLFKDSPDSVLLGLMSPSARTSGKISRVTFNSAIKPIYGVFGDRDAQEIYD
ncbi:MAG: DGQHR domain-containing protein, partial [Clostridiales bacterium]|nr:DGQHR domain-containing protein [Clostridiales bacterium]